jgi:hypothetical protein
MSLWNDVAGVVGAVAPTLGTILGGPLGGVAGSLVAKALGCASTPDAVSVAMASNPDAVIQLKQLEVQEAITIEQLKNAHDIAVLTASTSQMQSVNETLQTEAKSTFWFEANSHSINTTLTVILILLIYFGLPACHIPIPVVPESVFMMLAAILGVTSWQMPSVINAKKS